MIEIPEIETERLRLCAPAERHIEAEAEFMASDRAKYVGGPMTMEQTWRAWACIIGHWHMRGYGFWAVEAKDTGTYVGHVGLWCPHGWPEPEIGWSVMAASEGKGFAQEAALAARDFAYGILGWTTAISLIAPENARSIALAERLGATLDGEFDHERYGRTLIYRHPSPEDLK